MCCSSDGFPCQAEARASRRIALLESWSRYLYVVLSRDEQRQSKRTLGQAAYHSHLLRFLLTRNRALKTNLTNKLAQERCVSSTRLARCGEALTIWRYDKLIFLSSQKQKDPKEHHNHFYIIKFCYSLYIVARHAVVMA